MAWQRASDGHRKVRANDSWEMKERAQSPRGETVHGRFFTTCFQNGKCDVLAHVGLISSWYMSWWVLMDLWWSLWSCCAVAAFCPNWDIALYDPFPVFSCGKIPKLPSPHKYRIVTHQTWFLCKEWKPVIAETWNWDLRSRFGMLPQPQQHIVYCTCLPGCGAAHTPRCWLNSFEKLFEHSMDVEPYRMPGVQQRELEMSGRIAWQKEPAHGACRWWTSMQFDDWWQQAAGHGSQLVLWVLNHRGTTGLKVAAWVATFEKSMA